ncbi:hypothetical protein NDU88_001042 [Pleurodeles waltl]|uniref:Uncharacterized protein n=1 Tax=Pleurodeles waltl TaxID=8319 RepID=A0AAV7P2K3_PLEWA|nr:hypothetical protein NDU88_001042 [Pleurodeles waltl]
MDGDMISLPDEDTVGDPCPEVSSDNMRALVHDVIPCNSNRDPDPGRSEATRYNLRSNPTPIRLRDHLLDG